MKYYGLVLGILLCVLYNLEISISIAYFLFNCTIGIKILGLEFAFSEAQLVIIIHGSAIFLSTYRFQK